MLENSNGMCGAPWYDHVRLHETVKHLHVVVWLLYGGMNVVELQLHQVASNSFKGRSSDLHVVVWEAYHGVNHVGSFVCVKEGFKRR